ncbi:MAG: CoA-binding protein [Deltaproteobacteria bacterium]|nr:CoA-binding protein [Deltaproteobacteria bacterium]
MQKISCELPDGNPPSKEIKEILDRCRTIAVVGLSPKEARDSNRVARYLIQEGFEVVPVNPGQREILGKTCYRSVADIPFQVDMVNLFLNPTRVPPLVDQAIDKRVRVIWMQVGVVHNAAAQKARGTGIQVIMDKCIMQEHRKLATV